MSDPLDLSQNLLQVRTELEAFCQRYERNPAEVNLLAVSKTKPMEMITAMAALGQRDFGENYLQEAQGKVDELTSLGLCWHFIGAIQSNKTRAIAERFDWVHTVASAKVARRLSDQRPEGRVPINVCLQVNIDEDPNKAGLSVDQTAELIKPISSLPNLRLRGLMTMPAISASLEDQRKPFSRLRQLQQQLAEDFELPEFDQLSMGMSGDLEAAIAEGATWVRIGTALFGARN